MVVVVVAMMMNVALVTVNRKVLLCVQLCVYNEAVTWQYVVVVARFRNNQWSALITNRSVTQQLHLCGETFSVSAPVNVYYSNQISIANPKSCAQIDLNPYLKSFLIPKSQFFFGPNLKSQIAKFHTLLKHKSINNN